jgi:hypothetical protein
VVLDLLPTPVHPWLTMPRETVPTKSMAGELIKSFPELSTAPAPILSYQNSNRRFIAVTSKSWHWGLKCILRLPILKMCFNFFATKHHEL